MHARELLELSILLAQHAPVLVLFSARLSSSSLQGYWTASKCRLDRWHHTLRGAEDPPTSHVSRSLRARGPQAILPVLEEILLSEVLTRLWAAILCAHDRGRQVYEAEPIARSIFIGHLEARQRALRMMLSSPVLGDDGAEKLNGLRRQMERWSDLLVAGLLELSDVAEFAVEPERCRDFQLDWLGDPSRSRSLLWTLHAAALRSAIAWRLPGPSANPDLNQRIAGSVLACFEPELFDGLGLIQSAWAARLTHQVHDLEGLLDELLGRDGRPSPRTTGEPRNRFRPGRGGPFRRPG